MAGVEHSESERQAPSGEPPFAEIIRGRRLSEKVADMILESITSRRFAPGDRLPSERELGAQFGVSRTVVREAVRILAAKGLVEVRPGSGARVAEMNASTVRESLSLFLRGRGDDVLDYLKVHEVRAMLEVQIAGLAATRATDEDIALLEASHAELARVIADVDAASVADVEFHRAIAAAAHNEFYPIMLDSIGDVLLEIRRSTLASGNWGPHVLDVHRGILDRIASHDPDGAREAMRMHLEEIERAWLARTNGPLPRRRSSGS